MIEELLKRERDALNYFFNNIDIAEVNAVFEQLKSCCGLIALTGVGKSGLVAKKIAATMTSTNTRAIFLSPVNALHGDLGIISADDTFLFLSKSGESDELMALIPALKNKGVTLIAVVSKRNSRLAQLCDLTIHLPLEAELCPFDMVPTISAAIQMLFGDLLAVALMQNRGLSLDEYALNHPAGRIGKSITLKVEDLMIVGNQVPLAQPDDTLIETLVELSNKRCGCVLIVNEKSELLGIFTDGDLRRTLQQKGPDALHCPLKELMSPSPRTITPQTLATEALRVMEGNRHNEVTVLPVINNGRVMGLIKLHDVIQIGL